MADKDTLIAAIEFGQMARIEKHRGDVPYILFTKGWPQIECANMYQLMEKFEECCHRLSVMQYNVLVSLADYNL